MQTDMKLYRREWMIDLLKRHKVDRYPRNTKGGVLYTLWDGKKARQMKLSDQQIMELAQELG